METNGITVDDVWDDLADRFDIIVGSLHSAVTLVKPLPEIVLTSTQSPRIKALVRRRQPEGDVSIELGRSFLAKLIASIDALDDRVLGHIIEIEGAPTPTAHSEAAIKVALLSISELFVVFHEMFHVLCGHLDERIHASAGHGLELEELPLDQPPRDDVDGKHERDLAFFMELEADASALQFMTECCTIDDIRPLLAASDAELDVISDLTGPDKILAFRLLFAGIWQVVLQFESSAAQTHPWPAARLFSLLSTLMEHYVEGATLVDVERGQALRLTTDAAVDTATEYLRHVVGPATRFALAQLGEDERVVLPPNPTMPSNVYADVLADLESFVFGRDMRTAAGRQLDEAMRLRARLAEWVAPHRYITGE